MQPRRTGVGEAFTHAHIHTHPEEVKIFSDLHITIILSIPDLKALRAVDYILCVYIYVHILYICIFQEYLN